MRQELLKWLGVGVACWLAAGPSLAADVLPPEAESGWDFTVAAYLWASGINGETGVLDQPPEDIDASFSDILENLDFAAMGLAEARNGPFVLGMDLTYVKLGAETGLPEGAPAEEIDISVATWMVTGYAGYSIVDAESFRLDLVGGARLWSLDTEFNYDGGALDGMTDSDGASWVDPVVGAKMRLDLMPDVYVTAWGLVGGGLSSGSELMWDVMAGAGYDFTDSFSLFAGYRAVSVDYSDDGLVYDIVEQGPILAAAFRF
ncbi:hypothetical protein [Aestuariivirga sp.]|uniref:hypothetical protein n=1 Tax=Aestuariivirga sp. TaxID=2650926 RepID=UPI00391A937E